MLCLANERDMQRLGFCGCDEIITRRSLGSIKDAKQDVHLCLMAFL